MSDAAMLDKTFSIIMKHMVETGQAPHYTEIARELGLPMEEGRQAVHELFSAGYRVAFSQYKPDNLLRSVQQSPHPIQD